MVSNILYIIKYVKEELRFAKYFCFEFAGLNECYDWSDETEDACSCEDDEKRCKSPPTPPGERPQLGKCKYF